MPSLGHCGAAPHECPTAGGLDFRPSKAHNAHPAPPAPLFGWHMGLSGRGGRLDELACGMTQLPRACGGQPRRSVGLVGRKHSADPGACRVADHRAADPARTYPAGFQFQGSSSSTVTPGQFTLTITSAR